MENNCITATTDKRSSIEVNQNAKGEYSFSVKVYYDENEVKDGLEVIKRVKEYYNMLESTFKGKK